MKVICPSCGRSPSPSASPRCRCAELFGDHDGTAYPLYMGESGVQLYVRPAWGGGLEAVLDEPRLAVWIEIGEDTTRDELDKVLPLAWKWREVLAVHQGRSVGPREALMMELETLRAAGKSPRTIARLLNARIVELLEQHVAFLAGTNTLPFRAEAALSVLEQVGMGTTEARRLVKGAVAELQADRPAFDSPDDPVDGELIKARLRSWRHSVKTRKEPRARKAHSSDTSWEPEDGWLGGG